MGICFVVIVMKKKLLIHVCCAPCATQVINELKEEYNITLYFFNPNIHPLGEYAARYKSMEILSKELGIDLIEEEFEPELWLELIKGYEEEPEGGRRCLLCFDMRMRKTARFAKENGFDLFTTTLTISPHKDSKKIIKTGKSIEEEFDIPFLARDFENDEGFKKSIELSNKYGLYRQRYCGCFYSVK